MKRILIFCFLVTFGFNWATAQQNMFSGSNISGNFQFDGQSYKRDSLIGAEEVPQKILTNTWFRLNYNYGGFYAAIQYEAYLDPILGYDPRLKGNGFAYRSLGYKNDLIDVVAGNFYEQFGSGMIFRAYEERQLGWNNSMDGARIKLTPMNGLEITGLVGTMKAFWNESQGLIRGADINLTANDLFERLLPSDLVLTLGGSFMSRYQADNSSFLKLPENVFAWSPRFSLNHSVFALTGEYAYKYNDPNATNQYSYNPGTALYLTGSVFPRGLGVNVGFHRLDNMDFRADREAIGQTLQLNYIPALTKQHTFRLMTMYPYATQLNGEMGIQVDVTTNLLKKLFKDRKNADLYLNYSRITNIDTTHIDDYTYNSTWGWGNNVYYQEISAQFNKTWSRKFQTELLYANQIYNKDVLEHEGAEVGGKVYTNIIVFEGLYKITRRHTIRIELQHLSSTQDSVFTDENYDRKSGNWAFFLAEYSISPNWFFSIMDEYNYDNPNEAYEIHYPSVSMTYALQNTQVSFSYGQQRGGLICVGGVCRPVPASNGFRLSVTTSF